MLEDASSLSLFLAELSGFKKRKLAVSCTGNVEGSVGFPHVFSVVSRNRANGESVDIPPVAVFHDDDVGWCVSVVQERGGHDRKGQEISFEHWWRFRR